MSPYLYPIISQVELRFQGSSQLANHFGGGCFLYWKVFRLAKWRFGVLKESQHLSHVTVLILHATLTQGPLLGENAAVLIHILGPNMRTLSVVVLLKIT